MNDRSSELDNSDEDIDNDGMDDRKDNESDDIKNETGIYGIRTNEGDRDLSRAKKDVINDVAATIVVLGTNTNSSNNSSSSTCASSPNSADSKNTTSIVQVSRKQAQTSHVQSISRYGATRRDLVQSELPSVSNSSSLSLPSSLSPHMLQTPPAITLQCQDEKSREVSISMPLTSTDANSGSIIFQDR